MSADDKSGYFLKWPNYVMLYFGVGRLRLRRLVVIYV